MAKTVEKLFELPPFTVTMFDGDWIPLPSARYKATSGREIGEWLELWRQFAGGVKPLGDKECETLRRTILVQVEVGNE